MVLTHLHGNIIKGIIVSRIHKTDIISAATRAGKAASPDMCASFCLAPTLARDLAHLCSSDFINVLSKEIALAEKRGTPLADIPLDPEVIRCAEKEYYRKSKIGGVGGLLIGAIGFGLLLPPLGFVVGIFFPGVILWGIFSNIFETQALSESVSVTRALSMAYGVHVATKKLENYWQALTWREFEKEVANLFREIGFLVTLTPGSGDEGVDLLLSKAGKRVIVQCKKYTKPAGPHLVRELLGTFVRQGADVAILIATAGFTDAALHATKGVPIILLDLNDLLEIRRNQSIDKYFKI